VPDMNGLLAGRVAVVTGAARGLGESIARLFAGEGARVVIADVRADEGRVVAAELGASAAFVGHDVTDEDSWRALVDATVGRFGPPDVLVNNAGIGGRTTVLELDRAEFDRVLAINLTGPLLGMKVVGAVMRDRGRGSIVNVSSMAGMVGVYPAIAYSASKWGLRGATKAAAIELGRYGVRVNSLHPGGMATPMVDGPSVPLREPPGPGRPEDDPMLSGLDAVRSYQPIPRIARPIEIARTALFLASDQSSYCTGMELVADGGRIAGFDLEREPTS